MEKTWALGGDFEEFLWADAGTRKKVGELGLIGFVFGKGGGGRLFHNAFWGKGLGSFLRLDELGLFGFGFRIACCVSRIAYCVAGLALFGFVFWGRSGAQYWCNSFWQRRLHWFWP